MKAIEIGQDTLVGEFVSIRDSNHEYADLKIPIYSQGYVTKSISISSDVWIGRGCIILPGVTIGKHSVIGANSVINQNVDPFSVVGGIPAKLLKKIRE